MDNRSIRKTLLLAIMLSVLAGFFSGGLGYNYFVQNASNTQTNINTENVSISKSQSKVTSVVEKSNPAVVSIIVNQDLPKISDPFFGPSPQREQGQQQIGGGTGFVVSSDGLIVTNKHVVNKDAEYTVLFNDGNKVEADVEALHPTTDLALLDVERTGLEKLDLASSDKIKVGQTVIAIGNALGEFQNTVSKGIISGLNRSITASGTFQNSQRLTDLIQTDAAINPGNSGGPLLDINGKVVGINVAVAQQAQNIGFAIPSNTAVEMIEDFDKYGEIRVPFLGVRYVTINETIQETNDLSKNYGALLIPGNQIGGTAVVPNSPADKAGLKSGDIILKINDQKITQQNTLASIVEGFEVGDTVTVTVLQDGEEITKEVTLEQRPSE